MQRLLDLLFKDVAFGDLDVVGQGAAAANPWWSRGMLIAVGGTHCYVVIVLLILMGLASTFVVAGEGAGSSLRIMLVIRVGTRLECVDTDIDIGVCCGYLRCIRVVVSARTGKTGFILS